MRPTQSKHRSVSRRSVGKHSRLTLRYLRAKQEVIDGGFDLEIEWQESRSLDRLTEQEFLREIAWVILSTGMSEAIIRRCFPGVSAAFLEWRSALEIQEHCSECLEIARRYFNNRRKLEAIVGACSLVASTGFDQIRDEIRECGVAFLRRFNFIGPITQYHLGKNIGLQVVKPDRHLKRMAASIGFESAAEMCGVFSDETGDSLAVVDLVLWRYATLDRNYGKFFV